MTEALLSAGVADALAGEASDEDIDSFEIGSADCSYVVMDGDSWPSLCEDAASELIALYEPSVVEASKVQTVVEKANAREEAAAGEHVTPLRLR